MELKAEIINGQLVLIPANETEQYALIAWERASEIQFSDPSTMQRRLIKGTAFMITRPAQPTPLPPQADKENV